jgi:hypothetical protein
MKLAAFVIEGVLYDLVFPFDSGGVSVRRCFSPARRSDGGWSWSGFYCAYSHNTDDADNSNPNALARQTYTG